MRHGNARGLFAGVPPGEVNLLHPDLLRKLLAQVARGDVPIDGAIDRLRHLPFENVDFARIDHHRALRCGMPEVIFGEGKTARQVDELFARMASGGANVLATRVPRKTALRVQRSHPGAEYDRAARVLWLRQRPAEWGRSTLAVVAAGTSDLPVAEEARLTAELMDQRVDAIYDVGVAGLHRLLATMDRLRSAAVVVVVAGMEGALPSVVGGLIDAPIVAVPTSVGYGASFGGVAALLAMLNACASGITVVNIDNGFGAAMHAVKVCRRIDAQEQPSSNGPARLRPSNEKPLHG